MANGRSGARRAKSTYTSRKTTRKKKTSKAPSSACQIGASWTKLYRVPKYLKSADGEWLDGYYDDNRNEIVYAGYLEGIDVVDTVIHEIVHRIDKVYGLGLKHSHVYTIAHALAQALTTGKFVDEKEFERRLKSLPIIREQPEADQE